ncbi:DUF5666 domain-containing protein [Extibacter muris]|uniref:DUF5666 domain-containing protein n=1 Tax=Extibacter muris TaxID=1796622 RepID=A0A4R4FC43_9FIRM|nr:DUF5666 domain-containing protein [Extibacter muris]MCU0079743.1 DUF5666 domain-containing protein [Extibacter muris]TDA20841.1 hypothetical protein E1963_14585 [Extibacter muris]
MKNRVKKVLMLTGILCIMGVFLCACQNTKEVPDENQEQEEVGGTTSGDNAAEDASNPEPDIQDTDDTNKENQSEANDGEITTTIPNLEGTIKDIQGKQLTVVEAITEKGDNSGDVIVGPGSGDDSEFNKITVTYDDNTVFVIKNIYDGGTRSESENGTVSDLAAGQMVEIWGTSAADGLQATQICIVNVVSD